MKLHRDFASQEDIDARCNVIGSVPDAGASIQGWADHSATAVARLNCRLDMRYGPTPAEHRPTGLCSTATTRVSASVPCRWSRR